MSHRRQHKLQGVSLNSRGWIEREKHLSLEEAKRDVRARNGPRERAQTALNNTLNELQRLWAKIPPAFTTDREAVRLHFRFTLFPEWPARQILEKEGKLKPGEKYFGDDLDRAIYKPTLLNHAADKWGKAVVSEDQRAWKADLVRVDNHVNLMEHIIAFNELDVEEQRDAFRDLSEKNPGSPYEDYALLLCKTFCVVEASRFNPSCVKALDEHLELVDDLWEETVGVQKKRVTFPARDTLKDLREYDSTLQPPKKNAVALTSCNTTGNRRRHLG